MSEAPHKAASIVVDMQEDFCEPNRSLALSGGRELAPIINELLELPGFALRLAARDFHPQNHVSFASVLPGAIPFKSTVTVLNPENKLETQTIKQWPDHCVQGSTGCEIIPEIHKDKFDAVIEKGMDETVESYSAFGPPFRNPPYHMTRLDSILKEARITHLFCAGLSYNVCVFHTAVDAVEHAYETYVISDATASRLDAEGLVATQKALEEAGVTVVDTSSQEFRELLAVR